MHISCCTWALSGPEAEVLSCLAETGFRLIDFRPFDFRSPAMQSRMRALDLSACCMATAFGMPDGAALDSPSAPARDAAVAHTVAALEYGARLGMSRAYLLPGFETDRPAVQRYAASLAKLAERAQQLGVKLCIEHFPGRSLPTIEATLAFLRDTGHPNLYLLLDAGHAQISKEDAVRAIETAGPLLGYVHLDDNDGEQDLHWALCDGVMSIRSLRDIIGALYRSGYDGPVSLEMHPTLPDPLDALARSLDTVCQAIEEAAAEL